MAAKVALVTGANSGLGMSLTLLLAKEGWKVWAGMRDFEKRMDLMQEAERKGIARNIRPIVIDANDEKSVDKAFKFAIAEGVRLDLLVNNAGFATFGGVEMLSMDKIKAQFETNVFGVIRCTQAALPTFRKQRSGKIINVTSVGGVWGQCFNDVYCASKFAVEGMSEAQSAVFREFGTYITCVEPGGVQTKFARNAVVPSFEKLPAEYTDAFNKTMAYYSRGGGDAQTGEECAQSIMDQVVNVEKPPLRVQTNKEIQTIFAEHFADASGEAGVKMNQTRILGK